MSCLLQRAYRANLEVEHIPETAKTAKYRMNETISDTEGGKQPGNNQMQNGLERQIEGGAAHRRGVLCQVRARASALVAVLRHSRGCNRGALGGGKGVATKRRV